MGIVVDPAPAKEMVLAGEPSYVPGPYIINTLYNKKERGEMSQAAKSCGVLSGGRDAAEQASTHTLDAAAPPGESPLHRGSAASSNLCGLPAVGALTRLANFNASTFQSCRTVSSS
jgi:hypothetical protein